MKITVEDSKRYNIAAAKKRLNTVSLSSRSNSQASHSQLFTPGESDDSVVLADDSAVTSHSSFSLSMYA
ncbi:hypothetical protein E2C01_060856 [Portunus trituberculatus]|uniref:Uncharacterized protein n=1 Tax=Portunus trituberculatus TaxID=210409 RepID=A0A5B7HDH5_PORTR|nr:hypothetical protein [Portunus trituberculatus]